MRKSRSLVLSALAASLCLASASVAESDPAKPAPQECFFRHLWRGWKAAPDAKSVYIALRNGKMYRLDLTNTCPNLRGLSAQLVAYSTGNEICTGVGFEIEVAWSDDKSPSPCWVNRVVPLSADEAAALPKSLRP